MQLFVCCHLHHAALQHSKRSGWNRALHAPRSGENGRQVSRTLTGLQHSTRATFILQPYGDFGQHRAPDTVLCKPVSVGILLQVLHFLENFQSITINAGTHTCHRFSRVRLQYRLCELWAAVLSMCCIWFPWLNQSDDSSVAAAAARWVRPGAPCEASPSRARWSERAVVMELPRPAARLQQPQRVPLGFSRSLHGPCCHRLAPTPRHSPVAHAHHSPLL